MTKLINGNNNFWKEELEKFPIIFQDLLQGKDVTLDKSHIDKLIISKEKINLLRISNSNGDGYEYTTVDNNCIGIMKIYNFISNGSCLGYSKSNDVFYIFENSDNQTYGPLLRFKRYYHNGFNFCKENESYYLFCKQISEIEFKKYLKEQKDLLTNQNILIKELNTIVIDYLNPFS